MKTPPKLGGQKFTLVKMFSISFYHAHVALMLISSTLNDVSRFYWPGLANQFA